MTRLLSTFLICLTSTLAIGQRLELGQQKSQIEQSIKGQKGANISSGMNNEGLIFLMDEGHDGMRAWYFDDNDRCIAVYLKFNSEAGRDLIIMMKKKASKDFNKIDYTQYCIEDYCWKFSTPSASELAVLVHLQEM